MSLEYLFETLATELIKEPTFSESPWVQQIESEGPSNFARKAAKAVNSLMVPVRLAMDIPSNEELDRLRAELDELAEYVDRLGRRAEPAASAPGLPASQPMDQDLIDLFTILIQHLLRDGLTEAQARDFFVRDRASPNDGPGAREARRALLKCRREIGFSKVLAAERMVTVPVVFSVVYASARRQRDPSGGPGLCR